MAKNSFVAEVTFKTLTHSPAMLIYKFILFKAFLNSTFLKQMLLKLWYSMLILQN